MPLPLDWTCAVDPDTCCVSLYDQAAHILAIAYDELIPCMASCLEEGDTLAGYVSMGRAIIDPAPDRLVVSLIDVAPSPGSTRQGKTIGAATFRGTFQVQLLESGWPLPTGDDEEIIPVPPELFNAMSQHAYSHGEVMYRALAQAVVDRSIYPGSCGDCFAQIGNLIPIDPSGPTTGWQTQVTVEVLNRGCTPVVVP